MWILLAYYTLSSYHEVWSWQGFWYWLGYYLEFIPPYLLKVLGEIKSLGRPQVIDK